MKLLRPIIITIFACFCMQMPLSAASSMPDGVRAVDRGPVHEAYVQKVAGSVLLEAVANQPPAPVTERIPEQTDSLATWIKGYWSWDKSRQDFVWVSGVWRRPPPNHQWIEGYWEQIEKDWVWIPGFWSEKPANRLEYIKNTPPDLIDENVENAPGKEYFWASGYWMYSNRDNDFDWVKGTWERMDPNWVWVPAHYMWHPDGYIFVAGYWDWELKERGQAYMTVTIDPSVRGTIVYEPTIYLPHVVVIEWLFPYFPNYLGFFYHWHFYHPGFWNHWCCVPPWWGWQSWWGFSWHNAWGLWWWWGHPGFLQPWWITNSLAGMIPPPLFALLSMMNGVFGPQFILKNGMVAPNQLLQAIKDVTGKNLPIMPSEPDTINAIKEKAEESMVDIGTPLRPSGPRGSDLQPPYKPWLDPEAFEELAPGKINDQTLPRVPQVPPQILPPPPIRRPEMTPPQRQPEPPVYQPRPPRYPQPPSYSPRPPRYPQPPSYSPRPPRYPQPPSYQPRPKPTPRPTPPSNRYPPQGEFQPHGNSKGNTPWRPMRPMRPLRPMNPQIQPNNIPQTAPPSNNSNSIFK